MPFPGYTFLRPQILQKRCFQAAQVVSEGVPFLAALCRGVHVKQEEAATAKEVPNCCDAVWGWAFWKLFSQWWWTLMNHSCVLACSGWLVSSYGDSTRDMLFKLFNDFDAGSFFCLEGASHWVVPIECICPHHERLNHQPADWMIQGWTIVV